MQGGWKGDPVITAMMYEDDLQLDKENYSAFRDRVEGSCMMALLYHLMGKDEYSKNFEGLIKTIIFINDEMNYSDNLSHGYLVAGRGIYVFDSNKNVIATVWPHIKWNVNKEGKRYLFFVVGVYPGQLLD